MTEKFCFVNIDGVIKVAKELKIEPLDIPSNLSNFSLPNNLTFSIDELIETDKKFKNND